MSESMVERVARAIEPAAFATVDRGFTYGNAFETHAVLYAEKVVRHAREQARAAIEAMPFAEARFLLDRLSELEIPDELARDWCGHVEPAIARLDAALSGPS